MVIVGEIDEIIISSSGLESVAKINFGEQVGSIFCYVLLAREYEPGERPKVIKADSDSCDEPVTLKVGEKWGFDISVIFVSKYKSISNDETLGYNQPIHESSHAKISVVVKKIIDEGTMLCNIDGLGEDILVNCDISIDRIGIGDMIQFNGEIKAEPFVGKD